ncbi:hypothetical protein [Pyxidicoccus xibeiensis]|uniref:hypothetical protein n=1 Tax=Pyxidicoccus xibeiensis TaxID=2906759 RepID=UPI0020A75935|nr:hypothetical protein [Pyxidicoccus xibeiensis]MCP3143855.1 hypothetical protein [Pyxidicoccus xibeiensis]
MKKYVLLSLVAAVLVGCGGVEGAPGLEGQEEVATLPDGSLATLKDVAGEEVAPVIQVDETGRVTATAANCRAEVIWCRSPATGKPVCVKHGRCSGLQGATVCAVLIARIC